MKKIIFILVGFLFSYTVFAQDDNSESRAMFNKAMGYYDIGRFEKAINLLDSQNGNFSAAIKSNVIRLYALCYMAMDDSEKCMKYLKDLLNENPGYTSVNDPPRFRDMVEEFKKGINATITTASFSSETVDEAPVSVTVITEEMIRAAGAQTVQDVLVAYVPSVSVIESNGIMNFAYRGVYGASQDKVLMMLNGIRLNSYYSNIAMSDYSLSIEKIKQIEVLRGPSSSLYGDAALTGVVNIITKDGIDTNGFEVSGGVGNFGQLKGGVIFGKHIYDLDVSLWGSIYRSDGQQVGAYFDTLEYKDEPLDAMPQKVIIGGYNKKPSYDYGIKLKYKDFSLLYSCNSSKTNTPYTKDVSNGLFPYSYYDYDEIEGNSPGASYCFYNLKFIYDKDFGKFNFSASMSYNREKMLTYYVRTDTTNDVVFNSLEIGYDDNRNLGFVYYSKGLAAYNGLTDGNFTTSVRVGYSYGSLLNGGTLIMGFDYSIFHFDSNSSLKVHNFAEKYYAEEKFFIYKYGDREPKNDYYLQLKHRFGRLIINSGLRFDYKKHVAIYRQNENINKEQSEEFFALSSPDRTMMEFSPRISCIYLMDRLNFKLNYSKAFVDASYMARTDEASVFFDKSPDPEIIRSFQFTMSANNFVNGLETELNVCYNRNEKMTDERDKIVVGWDFSTINYEAVLKYSHNKFKINAHASLLNVVDGRPFLLSIGSKEEQEDGSEIIQTTYELVNGGRIFNIPKFSAGVITSYRFFDKMWFNVHLQYETKRSYIIEHRLDSDYGIIPEVFLVNPSLNFDFNNLSLDISVHNCLNRKYSLPGKCFRPIQQKGAWLMIGAKYRF